MSEVLEQIRIGWRALNGFQTERELQTISVVTNYTIKIRAGLIVENGLEIVLFHFNISSWPSPNSLPYGKGFDLGLYDIDGKKYLGLSRGNHGALELFEAMLSNVIDYALDGESVPHKVFFRRFLDRVRDWQVFMSRGRSYLSQQDEIGLVGELLLLRTLLDSNLPSESIIDWWKGPLHGTHDFHVNGGAIEVKTTTSRDDFVIEVFDMVQLDPSSVCKLYLFGVALTLGEEGDSLPDIVKSLRVSLEDSQSGLQLFDKCLNYAGYRDEHADNYSSKYLLSRLIGFEVTEQFPSLKRSSIPVEVFDVKYRLDLDALSLPSVTLSESLNNLGVILDGTS